MHVRRDHLLGSERSFVHGDAAAALRMKGRTNESL
jgi:hypothetical protein